MFHTHHIIPKHTWKRLYNNLEGVNSPSNLIKLSVTDHAAWHYEQWVYFGQNEDYVAWKCLSGQIGKEEIQWWKSHFSGLKQKGKKKPESFRLAKLGKPSNSSGKKWSIEQKINLSNQRKGKKRSKVWIDSFNLNQKKTYQIIDPNGNINIYKGLQDFYKEYNLVRSQVYACANGKRPDVNGFKINMIEEAITRRKRNNVSI